MNKLWKYLFIIIMLIFIFAQIFCINKINRAKNIEMSNAKRVVYKNKTLKEFNDELNCLKEKTILSANEINKKWYIKIKIQGDKEELLTEMSKLDSYDISNCVISKNKDGNSIILEISAKEST